MKLRMKATYWSGFFRTIRNEVFSEFWDLETVPVQFLQSQPFPCCLIMFTKEKLVARGILKDAYDGILMHNFNKHLNLQSSDVEEISIEDEQGRIFVSVSH